VSATYRERSRTLDRELLDVIEAWHATSASLDERAFDALALRIFAYQLCYNEPYARYCAALGYSDNALPATWREIPPVPSAAYKEARLATFDVSTAALAFETSGTTQGTSGLHAMETAALYDAALLAGFDRFMLPDGARLRYINLVPDPGERPHSSLGYMMGRVTRLRGEGRSAWYVRGDELLVNALVDDLDEACDRGVAVCIAGTAFAFVNLADALARRGRRFELPTGSRIMETGGFKGRSRIVERADLYREAAGLFGIAQERIVAEYGMTEMTSQWYDTILCGGAAPDAPLRVKQAPTWLRARVVGPDGKDLPLGVVGAIVHVDCANRSSCIAIQTEDLGALTGDGLVLLGRESGAALRGCSLDAESLQTR
jgi:hypothetical protein